MKLRLLSSALVLLFLLMIIPAPTVAYTKMKSRVVEDFNRASLGVTKPGNTGAVEPPDETWLHNPDGFVVYWIQYNSATTPSIVDNALKLSSSGDGWFAFGLDADANGKSFNDRDYDSIIVRLKGEKGGEENALYFNIQGTIDLKWENLRDPDNKPLGAITTGYKDYVISLRNSGMGETKGQRTRLEKGWNEFHINTMGSATVYIDSISQLQTVAYTTPVAPTAAPPSANGDNPTAKPSATEAPSDNPTDPPDETVYPDTDRDKSKSLLIDDFNRKSLMLDPELEVAPGGEFKYINADGQTIYWIQWNEKTTPKIENGALHLTMQNGGWYGTGADSSFADEHECLAIRIKGANGGEETALSVNPDTAVGGKLLSELVGPDGKPLPAITTEYQTIVIDLPKSGYNLKDDNGDAFAYQYAHFNSTADVDVFIDEIYWLAVNPGAAVAPPSTEPSPSPSVEPSPSPSLSPSPSPSEPPAAEGKSGFPIRVVLIIVLALVVVGAVTAAVILLTRKKK